MGRFKGERDELVLAEFEHTETDRAGLALGIGPAEWRRILTLLILAERMVLANAVFHPRAEVVDGGLPIAEILVADYYVEALLPELGDHGVVIRLLRHPTAHRTVRAKANRPEVEERAPCQVEELFGVLVDDGSSP